MRDYIQALIRKSLQSKIKKQTSESLIAEQLLRPKKFPDRPRYVDTYEKYLTNYKAQKKEVMDTSSLFIDSHFESGNMEKVLKDSNLHKYSLFMSVDTNTRGHQQWFYFRVRNMQKDQAYQLTILNFTKP